MVEPEIADDWKDVRREIDKLDELKDEEAQLEQELEEVKVDINDVRETLIESLEYWEDIPEEQIGTLNNMLKNDELEDFLTMVKHYIDGQREF